MNKNEAEILMLMQSVRNKYFKDIENSISFYVVKRADVQESVHGRMLYLADGSIEIYLYYSDGRILEHQYRWGLVPIIAHELSHIINPVEPDIVLAERLPESIVRTWNEFKESGAVECSFGEE